MNDKENKAEETKLCPYLDKPCIKGDCALYVTVHQNILGVRKVIGTCSSVAIVMMLANTPQAPPQSQEIDLSKLKR